MKSYTKIVFVLGALILFNSNALAQRGGETRGSSGSGETRGSSDGGSSRGDSGETRGSSSSSSSDSGGGYGGGSDYGSSYGSCCDTDYSGGGYGGGSNRVRNTRANDLRVGMHVELIDTGDKGTITYIRKTMFSNYLCIEFDDDHTEECGYKAKQVRRI